MESISKENIPLQNLSIPKSQPISAGTNLNTVDTPPASLSTNLPDIAKLSQSAQLSSSDIRKDAIDRATKLISDPNWLSDENLEDLSKKIIQVEDI